MGTKPGCILETIEVPIERPRQRANALTPEFIKIKERCLELLNVNATSLSDAA